MKGHPHDKVAFTVVCFLGAAALTFGLGVIFLVWTATGYEGDVDPGTVALISGVSTLAGAAMGALGSILASTGKNTPQPVTVENTPSEPVPTSPTEPTPALEPVDSEFGHIDVGTALVVLLVALVVLAVLGLI